MTKFITTIILFFSIVPKANSQDVLKDSKGDDVFTSLEGKQAKFTITSGDNSLTFYNLFKIGKGTTFYTPTIATGNETVSKSHNFLLGGKINSKKKYLELSDGTSLKASGSLDIGYVRSIDKFHKQLSLIPSPYSFGAIASIGFDNEKIYDTIAKKENKRTPVSFTMKLLYNKFLKKTNTLFSLSLKLANSTNLTDLPEYIFNPLYNQNNAVGYTEKTGRLGDLVRSNEARLRISYNKFFEQKHWMMGLYQVSRIRQHFKPAYTFGGNIFYAKKIFGADALTEIEGIALSFDCTYKADNKKFSNPVVFITGTFQFGKSNNNNYKNDTSNKGKGF